LRATERQEAWAAAWLAAPRRIAATRVNFIVKRRMELSEDD